MRKRTFNTNRINMKKLTFLFVFAAMAASQASYAQDVHFSQFYMTPLQVNPALAGAEYDVRGIMNYRSQWRSVTTPFVTYAASYDMNFAGKSKTGFWAGGISAFNDKAGDSRLTTSLANINVAYHVYLNDKNTLGVGTQAGFFQRTMDFASLKWGSQYNGMVHDPNLSSGETGTGRESIFKPDFASGLVWTYKKNERYMTGNDQMVINAGFSVQHLNRPNYTYQHLVSDRLHYRWVGHANALVGIPNTLFSLQPGFLFMQQGPNREILMGTNITYRTKEESKYTGINKGATMSVGGFYRNRDAFILTFMLEYANYTIGVNYDMNTSALRTVSNGRGGMELALRYVHPSPFGKTTRSKSRFN
jgi:type IX secretion system PorP/SprF family membrane protein